MPRLFEDISNGAHKGTLVQYGKAGQSPELSSVRGIGHINGEAARRRMEQLMSNQLRSGNGASGVVLLCATSFAGYMIARVRIHKKRPPALVWSIAARYCAPAQL